jgi:menaquinone-9 beta-reductase
MINIRVIQNYDCDVLIVGGGPGGSSLAYRLAEYGLKTIVLEAHTFPRDKVCGDGVSPIALAELEKLGISKLEKFKKANEITKVGLFINDEKVFIDLPTTSHLPFHARIIPRLDLDNWIYEAAKNKGAIFKEDTRLVHFIATENSVTATIKRGDTINYIRSKMIVGADGSNSTVARILNGEKASENFQLLGLRAYYENVNGPNDRVDIFFTKENFPGIYWMFPSGDKNANIGLAMVASTMPKNEHHVKTLLNNHIKQNKDITERIGKGTLKGKIAGWPLSFYNAKNSITANRLLLIGDAAGLINPLSGDGIQYALLSSRWASECIIECSKQNDFSGNALFVYRKKINKELAYDFALSNFLIQFGRNRNLTPLWMEIMEVMLEQAKVDKEYADIIAGIFEGTYPSYKALTTDFIAKSLLQGGIHIGSLASKTILEGPDQWVKTGTQASTIAFSIIDSLKQNPSGNFKWLTSILDNGLSVAAQMIKNKNKSGVLLF